MKYILIVYLFDTIDVNICFSINLIKIKQVWFTANQYDLRFEANRVHEMNDLHVYVCVK